MKKSLFLIIGVLCALSVHAQQKPDQTIFAFGGDINVKFVQYVVDLTGKPDPKVCYVPTASADNTDNIEFWDFICGRVSIEPHVLRVWVSSDPDAKSFEETLLGMDAIVVGGGNTLNMLGIWKAQGIDAIMRKALERGIILAGGSAGSICWFRDGISDSRPVNLSVVDGLSFLPYSNCPHYGDSAKKELYHREIARKKMKAGYATDDKSAVLFGNGKFVEAVSQSDASNSYYVSLKKGEVVSEKLPSRILVDRDALPEGAYDVINVGRTVGEFPEIDSRDTPLDAYVSIMRILANGQNSRLKQVSSASLQERMGESKDREVSEKTRSALLGTPIEKVFVHGDTLAAVVSEHSDYYGVWYFYKENGRWMSAGEGLGNTLFEAEISFRENAKTHLEKIRK